MNRAEPLNLCRNLLEYCSALEKVGALDAQHSRHKTAMLHIAHLGRIAQKFSLPEGGRVLQDASLKGLDEHLPLRLPFPVIALEYLATRDNYAPGMSEPCRRRIVFAMEAGQEIAVLPVIRFDGTDHWAPMGVCRIPKTHYIVSRSDGAATLKAEFPGDFPNADYEDELATLLCLLNALQCSNVHIERTQARKTGKKCKTALPFDAYHQLVIDVPRTSGNTATNSSHGDRRTAREHLRRGHIVRPDGRRPYWRNATVVNAGKQLASIHKDYAIRPTT